MNKLLALIIAAAFAFTSIGAIAAKHEGGMKDEKKVDCKDKKNAKDKACAKKKEEKK